MMDQPADRCSGSFTRLGGAPRFDSDSCFTRANASSHQESRERDILGRKCFAWYDHAEGSRIASAGGDRAMVWISDGFADRRGGKGAAWS